MRVALRLFLAMASLMAMSTTLAQSRVSITIAPPPIPVYAQPLCPVDGFIWTPGYWAWDEPGGYYWVPGTWLAPPAAGLLWTPGYWIWRDRSFEFVDGYWGPVVGFYGGIDYGFGYPGSGYFGGRWTGGRFFYNRRVSHVNVNVIQNTYVENVTVVKNTNRASYNGGQGGVVARPTDREAAAANGNHTPATAAQQRYAQSARSMPDLHAAANAGKPPVAATARPEALQDRAAAKPGSAREPPATRQPSPQQRQPAKPEQSTKPQQPAQAQPSAKPQQPAQPQPSTKPQRPPKHEQPSSGDQPPSADRPSNARNPERAPAPATPSQHPDPPPPHPGTRPTDDGRAQASPNTPQRGAATQPRPPPAGAPSSRGQPHDQQAQKSPPAKKRDTQQNGED